MHSSIPSGHIENNCVLDVLPETSDIEMIKTEAFLSSKNWPCSGELDNKLINTHRNKVIFDTTKSKKKIRQ